MEQKDRVKKHALFRKGGGALKILSVKVIEKPCTLRVNSAQVARWDSLILTFLRMSTNISYICIQYI